MKTKSRNYRNSTPAAKVSEDELKMAKLLINSMDTPFDPKQYRDEYQEKLRGAH